MTDDLFTNKDKMEDCVVASFKDCQPIKINVGKDQEAVWINSLSQFVGCTSHNIINMVR